MSSGSYGTLKKHFILPEEQIVVNILLLMFDHKLAFDRSIDQAPADAGDIMKQLHTARGVLPL